MANSTQNPADRLVQLMRLNGHPVSGHFLGLIKEWKEQVAASEQLSKQDGKAEKRLNDMWEYLGND